MSAQNRKIPLKEWLLHPRTRAARRKALRFYFGLIGIWAVVIIAWSVMNFSAPVENRTTTDLGINIFVWLCFLGFALRKRAQLKEEDKS